MVNNGVINTELEKNDKLIGQYINNMKMVFFFLPQF
jgi:hypothetical protein